jgi:hypothetical protein
MCDMCQVKHIKIRKRLVVKPIISCELNSRCQVDLIDFQSNADQLFKFIMVHQDHLTKFVVIRPLKTKTAEEVAYNLIDIFTFLEHLQYYNPTTVVNFLIKLFLT